MTHNNGLFGPVFPVLPSYTSAGDLDLDSTGSYVQYLANQGARTVMTTAGSSQFNLLSPAEISELNSCVAENFPGRVILGAPVLSLRSLERFIDDCHSRHPSAALLLIYPDRFYDESTIVQYFCTVAAMFPTLRFYIHAQPLRSGRALSSADYTRHLLASLSRHTRQFVGLKEEASTYEAGFTLCAGLPVSRLEVIVAGGSMRRFLLLHAAGAQSFLAGVGSLFPAADLAFHNHIIAGRLPQATRVISRIETPMFEVFMSVGWHVALRHAAQFLNLLRGERAPTTKLPRSSLRKIISVVEMAQLECRNIGSEAVL